MATPGPKRGVPLARNSEVEALVTAPTPRILGGRKPHPEPQALGLGAVDPRDFRMLHALHSTSTRLPCAHPPSRSQPPLSPLLLGIQMVSTMAPPTRVGRGPGPGPDHPSLLPQSRHVSPVSVCPPPPLPPLGRSLLLSPCAPAALTRLQLTFLASLPLLPSAPHRDVPGPATGPSASPSASLCTCLSLSCNLQ